MALSKAQYEHGGYSSQSFIKHEAPVIHKKIVPIAVVPVHAQVSKGHAVSSQSFVTSNTHQAPKYQAPQYQHQGYEYKHQEEYVNILKI